MAVVTRRKATVAAAHPQIIDRDKLIDELWSVFSPRWKRGLPDYCLVGDQSYIKPTKTAVQTIVQAWARKHPAYAVDRFDCDDYAWSLKAHFCQLAANRPDLPAGFACGIIWTEDHPKAKTVGHAYNWVYTASDQIWMIEPQSGKMWRPGRAAKQRPDGPNYDTRVSLVCG